MTKYLIQRSRCSPAGPHPADFPIGSLRSRAAARALQLAADLETREQIAAQLQNLIPFEKAMIESIDDPRRQALMVSLLRKTVIPKCKLFGWPLPTPEKIRENQKKAGLTRKRRVDGVRADRSKEEG